MTTEVSSFQRLTFSYSYIIQTVTFLKVSCKKFSCQKKVETNIKELTGIHDQSTVCTTSFVGITDCPIWHYQAATAIVRSSQFPKANSGYSIAHEIAIPVFFDFIYSQPGVIESSDDSSL